MITEHDCVVLAEDVPNESLQAGDVGTVVHVHGDHAGFTVEFATLAGETVTVVTLLPHQVRPVRRRDIVHVREFNAV